MSIKRIKLKYIVIFFILLSLIIGIDFINHKLNVVVDLINLKINGNPEELKNLSLNSNNLKEDTFKSINRLLFAWNTVKDPETRLHPYWLRFGKHYNLYVPEQNGADFYPFFEIAEDITNKNYEFSDHLNLIIIDKNNFIEVIDLNKNKIIEESVVIKKRDFNKKLHGTSEFIKDGLLPLIDYGNQNAYHLAIQLLGSIMENCDIECLKNQDNEVRGELLITFSRLANKNYPYLNFSRDEYKDYSSLIYNISIEDIDLTNFKITDHNNEIIQGMGEYFLIDKSTKNQTIEVLEKINNKNIKLFENKKTNYSATANYMLNTYHQVGYNLTKTLNELENLKIYDFANNIDDSADVIEEFIYLNSIYKNENADKFIKKSMKTLLAQQKKDGFYTYNYRDGNVMRTLILFYLYQNEETIEGYIPKINTFPTK